MEMLHVLNGDATRLSLELADVPGVITVWADILHQGPTLILPKAEWRRLRASYLSMEGYADEEYVLARYEAEDAVLERYREFDEVIFWLEHDLFDQLLLLRHLHWIGELPEEEHQRFRLICIGSYPGVPSFVGLGQLSPAQLKTLLPGRLPITREQIAAGTAGWEAFCAPTVDTLKEYLRLGVPALPFVPGALQRHLDDYPGERDGLSRSERQILSVLAEGPSSLPALFHRTQAMEERIYMGDSTFLTIARALAYAPHPLLTMDLESSERTLADGPVAITPTGRDVLEGRASHVTLNGLDKWMGGVHLRSSSADR